MRRRLFGATGLIAVAAVLAAARPAHANGRFPSSTSITFQSTDPQSMALGLTFGLVLSHDGGINWYWMCEDSIGYGGIFDPKYALGPDGTLYATTYKGLRVSRDSGCTFETATADQADAGPGNIAGIWVDALAVSPDGSVWVGTAENGVSNSIYRSGDQAHTFADTGLDSSTIWWKSIQIAPSDPQTIYVSGYQVTPSVSVFAYRSTDGGGHWDPLPLDNVTIGSSPLILFDGVDPSDPTIVYLRSVGGNGPAGDRLYRSNDGGQTWSDVLDTNATPVHVAVRADGSVVAGTLTSDDMTHGCEYTSTDRGVTFSPCSYGPQMACLRQSSDGTMYTCGANWSPDYFALASSPDSQAWTRVFRFHMMAGPLSCPAGTIQHDDCELQMWPAIKEQFGVTGPYDAGPSPPDAGTATAPQGCCSTGADDAGVVALIVVVGVVLFLVGRRRKKPCCK